LGKEIREVLTGYDLPVFGCGTFQRILYAKTAATGQSVVDAEPEGEASKEINNLMTELEEFAK
jgi:chromosome partitioning protein